MFEQKKNQEFSMKKCKNFCFTFSILFLLITCYFFFNKNSLSFVFLLISVVLLLTTFFLPSYLKLLAFYWERLGIFLGKIFSPIILILVYTITILPINLILRIFSLDLLKRRINNKAKSYWIKRLDEKINFRNQF